MDIINMTWPQFIDFLIPKVVEFGIPATVILALIFSTRKTKSRARENFSEGAFSPPGRYGAYDFLRAYPANGLNIPETVPCCVFLCNESLVIEYKQKAINIGFHAINKIMTSDTHLVIELNDRPDDDYISFDIEGNVHAGDFFQTMNLVFNRFKDRQGVINATGSGTPQHKPFDQPYIEFTDPDADADDTAGARRGSRHGGKSHAISKTAAIAVIAVLFVAGFVGLYSYRIWKIETNQADTASASSIQTQDLTTENGEITFTVPVGMTRQRVYGVDLSCGSSTFNCGFTVYLYDVSDYIPTDGRPFAIKTCIDGLESRKNVPNPYTLVSAPSLLPEVGDDIYQQMYTDKVANLNMYEYFACQRIGEYYVVVHISQMTDFWSHYRDIFGEIVQSARPAQKNP